MGSGVNYAHQSLRMFLHKLATKMGKMHKAYVLLFGWSTIGYVVAETKLSKILCALYCRRIHYTVQNICMREKSKIEDKANSIRPNYHCRT